MTYDEQILRLLDRAGTWVVSYNLEKVSTPWGYIGTRGLRTCRELETEGFIEKDKEVNKPYVSYRITDKGRERIGTNVPRVSPQFAREVITKPLFT